MIIVRIGNNIHVLWKIYNNTGSKYSLSGKVRRLWLSSAALEKEIDTYQIQYRNELVFTIDAGDLTRYGTYKLVLQLSESDSQTEDATYDLTQLFQIVARTYPGACKELDGEVDVQVTSVLNNVVVERIEGLSAYEIAVNEGYVGTESEWLESLNGVGIASIDQTVIAVDDGSYNEVTFTMTNGETYTIRIRNGSKSAAVTRDDIIFALGYTPVTPAELAAKTDVFFAKYNSTTWQEINEAVNAGKAVFLKKDEDIYPLVGDGGVTPKLWEFAFVDTGLDHHRAVCHNDDTWQSTIKGLATVIDLANKQDVISDLSAIRAGAALGATAYQKPSTGIPASDIASGVIPDISGKQDTLISGSNIKTINGSSILGSGDIQVQTEITMDNVPTSGSNNPVKSGGLYTALAAKQNNLTFDNTPIASSNNPVKSGGLYTVLAEKIGSQDIDNVVELTLAQYNALATKDARTMYIVSDSAIQSDHVGVASLVQTTTSTEDGGTNVWTCTLTNGQSFTLEVKNGNQGNSGYSGAAGELEVVNNVTQGGATAALSAEMGKTLEGEISQLGLNLTNVIATIRLGKAQDGYIYIYVGGQPQGYGFDPTTGDVIVPVVYGDVVSDPAILTLQSGGTGTIYVKLSQKPSAEQKVYISSRSEKLTLSASSLTFTEANWDTWQTVTLNNLYDEIGSLNTTIVLENSDPLLTETAIAVTLKGISYEDLVDTTIPAGAHTITAADFATVTPKNYGVILSGYNGQYTNIYVPEYIDYEDQSRKVVLKGSDSFANNTTLEYVEIAANVGVSQYGTSATAAEWAALFQGCTNLIGVRYNGTNITNLSNTFAGCSKLKFFDGLDRQVNAINLSNAFNGCTSLEYVQDLSTLNISNIIAAFRNCSGLIRILGLPQSMTADNATNTFNGCSSLVYCTVPSGLVNVTYMFSNCTSLRRLDCVIESTVTNGISSMLSGCSNLNVYCVAGSDFYTQMVAQYGSSSTIHILTEDGSELPNIVVWGDSDSSPNKGWKEWPKRLMEMVDGFNLKNQAVAGEFTSSTAARQGGNSLTVGAFEIPATTEKVQVTLTGLDGQTFNNSNVFSAGGDFNPCTIANIKGAISGGTTNYFTRAAAGTATQVSANSSVASNNDAVYNNADAIMLINLGNNAGWQETPTLLLNQIKMMVNHFTTAGGTKYIISGPFASTFTRTSSGIEKIRQFEALAAEEFGTHWFSLRQYLIDNGLSQNNLTPTASDTERIAAGQVPGSLLGGGTVDNILMYPATSSDDAHVNAYGSNSAAIAYYEKGIALGYWTAPNGE